MGSESLIAKRKVARNLEILRSIGEQIQPDDTGKRLLRNLCLTSKIFNLEFSRHLYRKINAGPSIDLSRLAPCNPNLVHTRAFILSDFNSQWPASLVNKHIRGLVEKMENLEIFEWSLPYHTPGRATIAHLWNSCRKVKGVRFDLLDPGEDYNMYEDEDKEENSEYENADANGDADQPPRPFEISLFGNLTSLTLHDMCGDLAEWQGQIVEALVKSRALRELALSIATPTVRRYDLSGSSKYAQFFDELCGNYAGRGGQPLRLKTLRMGQSIFPTNCEALAEFTDLGYLEELTVDNYGDWYMASRAFKLYPSDDENAESAIAFQAFSPSNCPNLRRLKVTDYRNDVHKFLCGYAECPSASKRLAFSFDSQCWGMGIEMLLSPGERYPGLPIQLRMMKLDLRGREGLKGRLRNLVVTNGDSLEGLSLTVGDLCEMDWHADLQELQKAFCSFTRLTQLHFNYPYATDDYKPFLVFEKLAMVCPSLQFIRSDQCGCLKVIRRDGTLDVEFEQLSGEEVASVELFSFF